jgi:pyruvate dehydrogenase E2 component (dihydrolipoamide acetyltransferase)
LAKAIIMPKFGFTQEESEILEWLHKEGDKVEKGDPIAVVSTDKISMEVEATEEGVLMGIKYKVGDVVPVTKVIAYILQPGELIPEDEPKENDDAKLDKKKELNKLEIHVTPVARKMIAMNQLKIEQIQQFSGKEKITHSDVEKYIENLSSKSEKNLRATPAARRIARAEGVILTNISGSGPKGRIQAADVKNIDDRNSFTNNKSGITYKSLPLNSIRRTIARNMTQSWQEIPTMTLQADVPVGQLETFRKDINASIAKKSKKITITALIAKAVTFALEQNRIVNSHFDGENILLINEINIGIATAIDDGLIVPVVHNADKKSITSLSNEIRDLSARARKGKLLPDELTNASFTISNLGMFEIDRFTAIINPPQAAILAVGKKNHIFSPTEENSFHVEEIITFTLCADHRVMDGVQAAKFLVDLKTTIINQKGLEI